MAASDELVQAPAFRDRKALLVVFGVLQILLGAMLACFVPLVLFATIASKTMQTGTAAPMGLRTMIPSVCLYGAGAVWFICMGIGSIMARRWARALVLISSWLWLLCGVVGSVIMAFMLPRMLHKIGENTQAPPSAAGVVTGVMVVMVVFMGFFYLVVPGILILVYGTKNVKATCEARDPEIRWTDRCPLPVLALSLMLAFGMLGMLSMLLYGCVLPVFGIILTGIPGLVGTLALVALWGYLARGTYRLKMQAWWATFLSLCLAGLSAVITFSRISMGDLFQKMHLPQQQLATLEQMDLFKGHFLVLSCGISLLVYLAYLLYVRRYFVAAAQKEAGPGADTETA